MANRAALISALAVMVAPQGALAAKGPVTIACNLPARTITGAPATSGNERIFRVATGSLQAWDPEKKAFGPNLCAAYSCRRAPDRAEGTISSASVAYTIGVAGGQGYWRVLGASGGGPRTGSCRIVSEPRR